MVDIRRIRQAARMSQVEICGLTHISRPRLSAAENGYLELSHGELAAIQAVIAEEPERRANNIRQVFAEHAATNSVRSAKALLEPLTNFAPRATSKGGRS